MALWIVLMFQFAFTASLLLYALPLLRRARRSRNWPTVRATVLDGRIVQRGSTSFEPQIEYGYVIGGCQYVSRRSAVGLPLVASAKRATKVVRASPKGSAVVAAVDPADPRYAVLIPGIQGVHVMVVGVAANVVFVGWIAVWALIKTA